MRPTLAALTTLVVLAVPAPLAAQSVLDRTPNLSGAWVGPPGALHLTYLHRFDLSDDAAESVGSTPTFMLGWGFGGYGLLGVHYSTSSYVVPARADEWEILARLSPLSTSAGAPLDFGVTAAWNEAAGSVDGELSLGMPAGPGTIRAVLRGFSDAFGGEDSRWAVGAGAIVDLGERVALAADVVRPTSLEAGEALGWGAGVQLDIPGTPNTLSLQAGNTGSATLQGSSRRSAGTRWGFELTVPLDPDRYGGEGADPAARTGEVDLVAGDTVRIDVTDDGFGEGRIVIRPGTYVVWTNAGDDVHSAVADSGAWRSPLMAPGEVFGRVFTEPGDHPYHCRLHPDVTAVVVVRGGGAGS